MDLRWTDEHEAFRAEARAWLEANVPAKPLASMDTASGFEAHRDWERTLHRDGWSVVSWPTEYGGRGADLFTWLVFEEEYWRARAPGRVNQNGLFLLGPTLQEHGTTEQKARFLPPMAGGDEIWAQGWSEPNAGSDMAAVRTSAVRAGDDWVITGQKTWCSRAAWADWIFVLVRTDAGSERHRGLSFVLVPLDASGVTVRPIRQLDGDAGFAEVFFDAARVPVANRLGQEGEGTLAMMRNLEIERLTLAAMSVGIAGRCVRAMVEYAGQRKSFGVLIREHGQVQRHIAESYAEWRAAASLVYDVARRFDLTQTDQRVEADAAKLFAAQVGKRAADAAIQVLGGYGYMGEYAVERLWRDAKLLEIGGGTLEAHHRNITKDLSRRG